MKTIHLLALAMVASFCLPLLADDDAATANKKALAKLKGQWQLQSFEVNGLQREPDQESRDAPIVIDGNQLSHKETTFTFTIDASTEPKLFDLKLPDDQEFEGIYKFENNTLTICLFVGSENKVRPLEFTTDDGSERVMVTLTKIE